MESPKRSVALNYFLESDVSDLVTAGSKNDFEKIIFKFRDIRFQ